MVVGALLIRLQRHVLRVPPGHAGAHLFERFPGVEAFYAHSARIRGEVENSILFRGVTIEKGVKVKNSIIMQKCDVQENSLLENVICDKNVVITKEKWLKGAQNYPLIVAKNVVI